MTCGETALRRMPEDRGQPAMDAVAVQVRTRLLVIQATVPIRRTRSSMPSTTIAPKVRASRPDPRSGPQQSAYALAASRCKAVLQRSSLTPRMSSHSTKTTSPRHDECDAVGLAITTKKKQDDACDLRFTDNCAT